MSHAVTLRAGAVALNTRNLREALAHIGSAYAIGLHVTDEGTVAFGLERSPLDRRAAAVSLAWEKDRLLLSAPSAWTVLSQWLAAALAQRTGAELHPTTEPPIDVAQIHALLRDHESTFGTDDARVDHADLDEGTRALFELVQTGRIELRDDDPAQLAELVRRSATSEALYEALLDSDQVEDVFLSQTEFVAELGKRLRP